MKKVIFLASWCLFFVSYINAQPGNLDASFGKNGIVTADLGAPFNYGFSAKKVLFQSDGNIYLIIQTGAQIIIAKRFSNGSADSTFGNNGFSSPVAINANDAILQQDGKVVVVGRTNGSNYYNFEILRYNTEGSLDSSFSKDGKDTTDFFESSYSEATSVAIQSDGKIVAAGIESINSFESEVSPFAYSVARYNSDGSLDKTFSGDGKEFNYSFAGANTIAIQQDGKIVIAGGDESNSAAFGIARYKTNGNLDSTFSGDGVQTTDFGYDAKSVTIQKDGKILIAGKNQNYYFTLARYNKNGTPDSTFGKNGIQTNTLIGEAISINLTKDGKIIGLGTNGISRYNKDGFVDNSFGKNGIITLTAGTVQSIALQNDEKIIAAGSVFVRYNKDGSRDNTFNKDGNLPLNIHPGLTSFSKTKIQKDGKVVVAGETWNGINLGFVIARFNKDGSVDSTFDSDGMQTISFSSKEHHITSLAIANDGKIVAAGSVFDTCDNNGCRFKYYILRCNSNGSLDHSFSADGIQRADFPVNSIALQGDGKIVVGGSIGSDFAVFRYKANGSLDSTFSNDGKQVTPFTYDDEPVVSSANSIAIQSDGKIVAGGITNGQYPNYVVVGYNTDGSLDSSKFGKRFAFSDAYAGHLVIQKDGKIVVAGSEYYRGSRQFDIVRFNTNGTLDSSFSHDGRQYLSINLSDYATSAAIQSDGKILVGGSAIIRFTKDGSLDSSFANKGILTTDEREANEFVNDIAVSDNKLYAVGTGSLSATLGVIARFLLNDSSNTSPTVSLTAPANNATYLAPAAHIKLSAAAADKDGTISKVEFYNGNTLLHTETLIPYGFTWKNVPLGKYTITAKAYDNSGNVTASAAVHISVVRNNAPLVSIVKPANNQSCTAPANVRFEAAASDTDGRVTKVEFYKDSTLLRTEYKSPYTYNWINVPAGTYTITAKAADNWGAQTTSAPITVTVTSNSSITSNRPYSKTEIAALNDALSLRLSPNPAGNVVNISASGLQQNKPATLSIISVSGIVLKTMQMSNSATQLDVSSLTSGVYTIKIVCGDKIMHRQFVKL